MSLTLTVLKGKASDIITRALSKCTKEKDQEKEEASQNKKHEWQSPLSGLYQPNQRRVQQRERSLSHSTVANSVMLNGNERSPWNQNGDQLVTYILYLKFLKRGAIKKTSVMNTES